MESRHWWFVARRKIIAKILNSCLPPQPRSILEIGCGTGGNLELLSCYGTLFGMEMDEAALALAKSKEICPVEQGALPGGIPFSQQFDLICLFDVLEHISEDLAALQSIHSRLSPNGTVLLTVPAYAFLWSDHDVQLHHKRRYTRQELATLFEKAGFTVRYTTYFNTFLFPVIALVRGVNKLLKCSGGTVVAMPPPLLNKLLLNIFACERFLLPAVSLPFGVSLLLLAERTAGSDTDSQKCPEPVAEEVEARHHQHHHGQA